MEKSESTITTIEEIIKLNFPSEENKSVRYFYRGLSNKEYKLISKIGRTFEKEIIASSSCIINRYNNLKEYLKTFLPSYGVTLPPYSDLRDWVELFHAQHYGAPTNLLDFSRNPLVALFFACQSDNHTSGMIHRIKVEENNTFTIDKKTHVSPYESDPKNLEEPFFLDPPQENLRIRAQYSIFCFIPIHLAHKPLDTFKKFKIESFEVPSENKTEIIRQLHMIGFNDSTLFPDLYGFGKYLDWKIRSRFPD